MMHLNVCYYHATYTFESESTLHNCLNVKEVFSRNRRDIWSLTGSNGIRTHKHLVSKLTLNDLAKLAKWLSCVVSRVLIVDCLEYIFTLKRIRDIIITYWQLHHTDKYSQHISVIWPVWLNGWVFVYELSGRGFESCYCHWNFRYRPCFEQRVPWHSGNYRV